MESTFVLLAQAGGQIPALFAQLVPVLLIFGIFYFLLLAPMRKRQKALAQLVENLKKGDRVITNGGIYGEIALVEGNVVHLKIADSVRVKVAKSAIAGLEGGEEGESK